MDYNRFIENQNLQLLKPSALLNFCGLCAKHAWFSWDLNLVSIKYILQLMMLLPLCSYCHLSASLKHFFVKIGRGLTRPECHRIGQINPERMSGHQF